MKKLITILSIALSFLLAGALGNVAQAQGQVPTQDPAVTRSTVSLSITPPHAEISIKPGKSIVLAFNIQNEGSVDLDVTPTLVDFTADPNTGEEHVLQSSSFSYAELQNLDKKFDQPFTLIAGQKDQLVVHFAVPADVPERDYYEVLLLKTAPSAQTTLGAAGSEALGEIGANLLISITNSGTDQGELSLASVKIPSIIDSFSPLAMRLFVKNTGKTYSKIQGEMRIRSAITKTVEKVFPLLEENVLANNVREAHASIQDPDDSKSSIPGEFVYHPLFLIGPYTIEIDLHSQTQQSQTYYGQVWALPISPLLVILAFLLIRFFLRKVRKQRDLTQLGA
ncbi:MAG TPA: hypothetical protein VFG51_01565 [Candidatus Saccharimonadia bacterium]|nr:hypothetical protein [Candidatus Saccharimonadia bacterium]